MAEEKRIVILRNDGSFAKYVGGIYLRPGADYRLMLSDGEIEEIPSGISSSIVSSSADPTPAQTMEELDDLSISSATQGDTLEWNGSIWVNKPTFNPDRIRPIGWPPNVTASLSGYDAEFYSDTDVWNPVLKCCLPLSASGAVEGTSVTAALSGSCDPWSVSADQFVNRFLTTQSGSSYLITSHTSAAGSGYYYPQVVFTVQTAPVTSSGDLSSSWSIRPWGFVSSENFGETIEVPSAWDNAAVSGERQFWGDCDFVLARYIDDTVYSFDAGLGVHITPYSSAKITLAFLTSLGAGTSLSIFDEAGYMNVASGSVESFVNTQSESPDYPTFSGSIIARIKRLKDNIGNANSVNFLVSTDGQHWGIALRQRNGTSPAIKWIYIHVYSAAGSYPLVDAKSAIKWLRFG